MSTEPTYEERVQAMEQEGMTTSDAQGVVDAEIMNTKTPRTDAFLFDRMHLIHRGVVADFAGDLERKLNEARKEAEWWMEMHCNGEYTVETASRNLPWEKDHE